MPAGIQSLIDGRYSPRPLKRYYFTDEMVDQVHLSDRIFQHILLKQLKPTFPHIMNKNCYHLHGPTGVKYATQRIRQVLQDEKPDYILRVDIKSYYKSIPHFKLLADIKKYYNDPKLLAMLENIITNPIETPRGYKNPHYGIALRGPLSQFLSGIYYLKPLDDAFDHMNVTYLRFQDDILILCQTKRQLNRCRRRMMVVLQERRLGLSRKKSYIGCIKKGFHYLGIQYPPTQTAGYIEATPVNDVEMFPSNAQSLVNGGGGKMAFHHQTQEAIRIEPHPRTLRKARENGKWMVNDGVSLQKIRNYLHRFVLWWVKATRTWNYEELLTWFYDACFDSTLATFATGLLHRHVTASRSETDCHRFRQVNCTAVIAA